MIILRKSHFKKFVLNPSDPEKSDPEKNIMLALIKKFASDIMCADTVFAAQITSSEEDGKYLFIVKADDVELEFLFVKAKKGRIHYLNSGRVTAMENEETVANFMAAFIRKASITENTAGAPEPSPDPEPAANRI